MSYQIELHEPIPEAVRRIAGEEFDSALSLLTDPGDDRGKAVHEARKHFKKRCGLLRLVRDEIGEDAYRRENIAFRDATEDKISGPGPPNQPAQAGLVVEAQRLQPPDASLPNLPQPTRIKDEIR